MEAVSEFFQALEAGGATVYPLLGLAVLALVVIVEKGFVTAARTRLPRDFVDLIETAGFGWDELTSRAAKLGRRNYFGDFVGVIVDNRAQPAWWIESRAGDAAGLIEKSLGRWLWVLETVVTAAPLLGLLGTITGMIRAFRLFGNQGLVDPAGVTGGVAEALIATALGLSIALIALFAYNYFSYRQATIMDEMERLGTRLVDRVRLDAGGRGAVP